MKTVTTSIGLLMLVLVVTSARTDQPQHSTLSVAQARRQAEILHDTLHTTLQVVHHRYYREDEGLLLPAAALREIFADIEKRQKIELHWLAVEGEVMNTDHRAKDDFELAAVAALKADKPFHEEVTATTYRRAGPITLRNECLKCHVPDRKSTEDRTAGLVITISLR